MPDDQIAPLVQVACPHCSFRLILDFEAANDPSLIEPGTGMASGFRSESDYRSAIASGDIAAEPQPPASPPVQSAPAPAPRPTADSKRTIIGQPAVRMPAGQPPPPKPAANPAADASADDGPGTTTEAKKPRSAIPTEAVAAVPPQDADADADADADEMDLDMDVEEEAAAAPAEARRPPPHTPPSAASTAPPEEESPALPSPAELSQTDGEVPAPAAAAKRSPAPTPERRRPRVGLILLIILVLAGGGLVGASYAMTQDPNPIPFIQELLGQ